MQAEPLTLEKLAAELERLGNVASVFLDGDDLKNVITEEAMHYVLNPDPKYEFLAMDHFEVNQAPFLRLKKTLIRLGRLLPGPFGAAVWLPVPESTQVTACVLEGTHHRYYGFGNQFLDPSAEMQEVLSEGVQILLPPDDACSLATVLAPVRDSLDDIVGVVELNAPTAGDDVYWS